MSVPTETNPPSLVRRSLICELAVDEDDIRPLDGELHFAQYGSNDLKIEMSSLIPKAEVITVVLLGRSESQRSEKGVPLKVRYRAAYLLDLVLIA